MHSRILKRFHSRWKKAEKAARAETYDSIADYQNLSDDAKIELAHAFSAALQKLIPEEEYPHALIRKVASGAYILDSCIFKDRATAVKRGNNGHPSTEPIAVIITAGPEAAEGMYKFYDWVED